ncbi:reverse transcriptase [Gossypium australe]|uniref:Reverse transcriptase n=1 Tax=Gossypium australe TaxID=47621 RepID=A0A5B6WGJ2_9ROSI|nr:reverse transcriptase [Gossypium australe]
MRDIRSQILFLVKAKVSTRRMEKIWSKCGFFNRIDVGVVGSKLRLSLGWRQECVVSLRSYSQFHIDGDIHDGTIKTIWRFTRFFGHLEEMMHKKRGRLRLERNIRAFRYALQDCDLSDLGFSGRWYTWKRGRLSNNNIRERLVRGVATTTWWDMFLYYTHSFFDHCLVVVDTVAIQRPSSNMTFTQFKFDASWCLEETCEEEIRQFRASLADVVPVKLGKLGENLCRWFKSIESVRNRRKGKLEAKLMELYENKSNDNALVEMLQV